MKTFFLAGGGGTYGHGTCPGRSVTSDVTATATTNGLGRWPFSSGNWWELRKCVTIVGHYSEKNVFTFANHALLAYFVVLLHWWTVKAIGPYLSGPQRKCYSIYDRMISLVKYIPLRRINILSTIKRHYTQALRDGVRQTNEWEVGQGPGLIIVPRRYGNTNNVFHKVLRRKIKNCDLFHCDRPVPRRQWQYRYREWFS